MFKSFFYISFFCFSAIVFAQNYTKHTVQQGETVTSIAQKYKITPSDIYRLNPDAQNGLSYNAVLLIPKSTTPTTTSSEKKITHTIVAKETLYGIATKYKTTVEAIEKANPILKEKGLQVGQVIVVPSLSHSKSNLEDKVLALNKTTHIVQEGETKYGIAKQYSITVDELEKYNPSIKDNLPVGAVLNINAQKKATVLVSTKEIETSTPPTTKPETPSKPEVSLPNNLYNYTVKAGETFYRLTHKFSISQASLIALNPELNEGVKEGMILRVPASVSVKKEVLSSFKDLTKSINNQTRKELVLFIPFNASKIQNDTSQTVQERLKKDKFLNLTLDFYSGALMAIDSAKTLGLNVNVRVFDSQETKNSTSALALLRSNDFSKADAVIGPFYQVNVEKIAEALENQNIPVISPLSKEEGNNYSNLYQSMPTPQAVKNAMFEYMQKKEGNIIAVVDPKKIAIKEYIEQYQKETQIVPLSDKGTITADNIKKMLVKGKMNYVIMESEKTGTINLILNTLIAAQKEYQVNLVILEENETLNFEEIQLSKLTKLKMTYPSINRDNDLRDAQLFERYYKKKNNTLPSAYATRGFDLTFDTLLRLSQNTEFSNNAVSIATQYVENKFDYAPKVSGGFLNEGVHILYYDTDLTIKTAN
ncbi:amino acid/amide ABC transporter substrate-binding protein (HAAT family) [Flavobacterium croceum DSM 17960]|uniref:Amino acid/amide ABC transporter substrate-binding protein (HAAT family) n=1 Tax=Flavobacterium croceum DSM 17960 TaxID=1121886 RepID=A0A2S4N9V6_9FLAO|nr:LysM peptidoglycan-binding domain-containing protein [Flavobacterium croceum]POS02474.1 amino acid/amide ABC transporter substrate-binding protein (HAAT family) [Flavobacterium croceum DSM 17960]